jgi:hypothetical protein
MNKQLCLRDLATLTQIFHILAVVSAEVACYLGLASFLTPVVHSLVAVFVWFMCVRVAQATFRDIELA